MLEPKPERLEKVLSATQMRTDHCLCTLKPLHRVRRHAPSDSDSVYDRHLSAVTIYAVNHEWAICGFIGVTGAGSEITTDPSRFTSRISELSSPEISR